VLPGIVRRRGYAFDTPMNRQSILAQFERLLPLAADWAAQQEQLILREGVPLNQLEMIDAKLIGVREPERVRLLPLDTVPTPTDPLLKAAAAAIHFLTPDTRGLTLQYAIFVRSDCWRDRALIAHELVHTSQYEQLGGILPFLDQYLFECVTIGYPEAPMEQEALERAASILRQH
jgi:hypothetical protein